MPRKSKPQKTSKDGVLPAVAAMKFWSRFKNPPSMSASPFVSPEKKIGESLDQLTRLPHIPSDDSLVFTLRISLEGSTPPIWRRVLVRAANLEILHHVIQLAMGWCDSHLHGFEIRKVQVPLVEDGATIDERNISIAQLHAANIKKFRYIYDFGDGWNHTVLIENAFVARPDLIYPHCIAGRGACPIEDVGGILNWTRLLESFRYPDTERDEELDSLLARVGTSFVPPDFSLEETNLRIHRAFDKRLRRKGRA